MAGPKAQEASEPPPRSVKEADIFPCFQADGLADELAKSQARTIRRLVYPKARLSHADDEADQHQSAHSHGHGEKEPSVLTAIASAVINFLLMFGLCCAYGIIMFNDTWNQRHQGLGVKMNLCTAMICGLLLAGVSKVRVAIGGPDLNPVIFLGLFVESIAAKLAEVKGLTLPNADGRRLLESCTSALMAMDPQELFRRLADAEAAGAEFCTGSHYETYTAECDEYHRELRATSIFAVAMSSAILGLIFFGLGRFKLSSFITYVPTNIMEAFLSCVGYKVFKYALKFCKYKPKMFIPAACVGVPLYFLKALHMGNPAIVIPVVLLVPLSIFYTVLFATGGNVDSARVDGWMFDPPIENFPFYTAWTDCLGSYKDINFTAWASSLGNLPVMIVVVLLDCMLKLSSTESKLPVKTDKDYEMQLYGAANALTTLCGSSVGYMQLKFNVINYGVVGTVKDWRGGAIYASLCGVCFFWTTDLFNYLPRFFLSTLLFFAGAGFVAENLWGSRKYLNIWEWLQIFVILAVFIILDSLLYAVLVGGIIVGVSFIVRYARIPCVHGRPLRGGEVASVEKRHSLLQRTVEHIANHWMLYIRLKGFVFFASAQKLTEHVAGILEYQEAHVPKHRRLHWIVFDCKMLDGLDSSASKALGKLAVQARSMGVHIMWCHVSKSFVKSLKVSTTITHDHQVFVNTDEVMHWAEDEILEHMLAKQQTWRRLHPMFELAYDVMRARVAFDPFKDALTTDASRAGCPWQFCGRLTIKAFYSMLWKPGEHGRNLFMVHTGKVGLLTGLPGEGSKESDKGWGNLTAVYGPGCFLNPEAIMNAPTLHYAVAIEDGEVIYWTEQQWFRMSREQPEMAMAMMRAVIRQQAQDAETAESLTAVAGSTRNVGTQSVAPTPSMNPEASMTSFGADNFKPPPPEEGEVPEPADAFPEDVQNLVKGMPIAEALGSLGFYDKVESQLLVTAIPMPERLQTDVSTAFRTYCSGPSQDEDGEATLPLERVAEALMYAGIFSTMFTDGKEQEKSFTEASFQELAAEASMARLGDAQVEKLHEIFAKYEDAAKGGIDHTVLVRLFRECFHPSINQTEVDGIASMWTDGRGLVDVVTFVAMSSRFIKKHELEWCLLIGLRDFIGKKDGGEGDMLTATALVERTAHPLTEEEAEELLWCSDFTDSKDNGRALDIRLVPAVLQPLDSPTMRLPPEPREQPLGRARLAKARTTNVFTDVRALQMQEVLQTGLPHRLRAPVEHAKKAPRDTLQSEMSRLTSPDSVLTEPWGRRVQLHRFLDMPETGLAAERWSVFMGIMIMVSVMTLFLEPLVSPKDKEISETEKKVWLVFEGFFTGIFTLEFLLRLCVADALGTQTICDFLKTPMNIVDLIAIMPFYIEQIFSSDQGAFRLLRVIRLMRLTRVVRLGRLARRSATFAPIAVILVVIWGIYLKSTL